jgi:hypothetical protein
MKRLWIALIGIALVFSLAQCGLFTKTVGYIVSSTVSSSVSIRYQNDKGDLTDVNTTTDWSTSFDLTTSERPFLAFIEVANFSGNTVFVDILEDSTFVSSGQIIGVGSVEVYYIVE